MLGGVAQGEVEQWVLGNYEDSELERWPDPDIREIFTLHGIHYMPNICSCL